MPRAIALNPSAVREFLANPGLLPAPMKHVDAGAKNYFFLGSSVFIPSSPSCCYWPSSISRSGASMSASSYSSSMAKIDFLPGAQLMFAELQLC